MWHTDVNSWQICADDIILTSYSKWLLHRFGCIAFKRAYLRKHEIRHGGWWLYGRCCGLVNYQICKILLNIYGQYIRIQQIFNPHQQSSLIHMYVFTFSIHNQIAQRTAVWIKVSLRNKLSALSSRSTSKSKNAHDPSEWIQVNHYWKILWTCQCFVEIRFSTFLKCLDCLTEQLQCSVHFLTVNTFSYHKCSN